MLPLFVCTVLAGCAEKSSDQATDGPAPTDTEPPVVDTFREDTGGGDAPDPALVPTDVQADCWYWRVFDYEQDDAADALTLAFVDPVLLLVTHTEDDGDADGEVDQIADFTYDTAGHTLSWSYDLNADGIPDSVTTATYDADALYTLYTVDDDGDGALEERWTYSNIGGVRVEAYLDEGDDGTIDMVYRYTYDAEGRRTDIVGDRGDDGIPESIATYTYVDPTGPDYTYALDDDADGELESRSTYAFDAEMRVSHYLYEDLVDDYAQDYLYTFNSDSDVEAVVYTYSEGGTALSEGDYVYTYLAPKMRATTVVTYAFPASYSGSDWTYTWDCD
jgi:hypothetical protein